MATRLRGSSSQIARASFRTYFAAKAIAGWSSLAVS